MLTNVKESEPMLYGGNCTHKWMTD